MRGDVVQTAKALLGKKLCTDLKGGFTSGIIVETEAYNGVTDRASHAWGGRLTKRTKTMYEKGGISYIYLCYGIHHLFNVITGPVGEPHAVLIRAVEPVDGIDVMLRRRKMESPGYRLTAGPGSMSAALGITTALNGTSLLSREGIWIEDVGKTVLDREIEAGPRVGVGYAGQDALLPWRFSIKGNRWKSPVK